MLMGSLQTHKFPAVTIFLMSLTFQGSSVSGFLSLFISSSNAVSSEGKIVIWYEIQFGTRVTLDQNNLIWERHVKSKCTEISSKAWPRSKLSYLCFELIVRYLWVLKGFEVYFSNYSLLLGKLILLSLWQRNGRIGWQKNRITTTSSSSR